MDKVVSEYCAALVTITDELPFYTPQLFRYLVSISFLEKIKDVIVVERPYRSDIHPDFFAAMSYDPMKSEPTPSTIALANVITQDNDLDKNTVENWFRDGWMKLTDGVLLLNVCYAGEVGDTKYHREVVLFQEFLRAMLVTAIRQGSSGITVYAIGNKPIYVVSRTLSSLGSGRSNVTFKKLDSPITLLHRRGDGMSRRFTRTNKGTLRSLSDLIIRTTLSNTVCSINVFDIMEESKKSVLSASLKLADEIDKVRKHLKDPVAVQDSTLEDLMGGAADGLREFYSKLTRLNMSMAISPRSQDQSVARPSLFGNKRKPAHYERSTTSYAGSEVTTPSNVSSATRVILRGFDDEDNDDVHPSSASHKPKGKTPHIVVPKFDDSDDSANDAPTPVQNVPSVQSAATMKVIPQHQHEVVALIYGMDVIVKNEWLREQLNDGIYGKDVRADVADMVRLAYTHYATDGESFSRAMGVLDETYSDVTHPVYRAILGIVSKGND